MKFREFAAKVRQIEATGKALDLDVFVEPDLDSVTDISVAEDSPPVGSWVQIAIKPDGIN